MNGNGLIDVNVSLGHWPFQWFDLCTAGQLDAHLAAEGIEEAWVSSIDAILYPDVDACDERLARQIAPFERLRLVKTINPVLANFRDSFTQAADVGIHAIRLLPNYHQVGLDDPRVCDLMTLAAARGVVVMVQMRVDDERNQYPLMKVPAVAAADVAELALAHPSVNFIALGTLLSEWPLLRPADNISVELSFAECFQTLVAGLREMPAARIMFGSHTPMFYTRSAVLKWRLADIDPAVRQQIACGNARRIKDAIFDG